MPALSLLAALWMLLTPTMIDGKCSACLYEGQRSTIIEGVSMVTLVYSPPFRDEDGRLHNHDSNLSTSSWTCSRGHVGIEKHTGSCWCGWPKSGPHVESKKEQ